VHFRIAPESRHRPAYGDGPRKAKGGRGRSFDNVIRPGDQCLRTVSPSTRAAFMLTTKSNFVGYCTGKSTVDVPRIILST
jgi:hypothetical protein